MTALRLWGGSRAAPDGAVRHLVAMQAQEHPYARWSVGQRSGADAAEVDAAFDAGRFLRTHVLRPTWHYVAPGDLRWLMRLSGPLVEARNERRYRELALDARTRARATDVITRAVSDASLTRDELADVLESSRIATGGQRMPYLLMHAELHAAICSGPMRGRAHTYAAFDARVPSAPGPAGDDALAELARRYFTTRGPATVKDFGWWAGLPAGEARRAVRLVESGLESRAVDGRTYWFGEMPKGAPRRPRVDLVQCYDEVIISYTDSRDVLATEEVSFAVPRHLDGFTHVVLLDGRLLGHWRVRPSRRGVDVETQLQRPIDPGERAALDAGIANYQRFVTPGTSTSRPSPAAS